MGYRVYKFILVIVIYTIDFDSLEDDAVTVRERDSMEQERVSTKELVDYLTQQLAL